MRIAIGADHAGYSLKERLVTMLKEDGHDVTDHGAHELDPDDDYPDTSLPVAQAVGGGAAERGVICCGSGVGATIVANKIRGVRAATCHDTYSASQGVEHDDLNVLTLGARVIDTALAREVVRAFIGAQFTGEERHARRLDKVKAIELSNGSGY